MNDFIQELVNTTAFHREIEPVLVPELFPPGTPLEKVTLHVCMLSAYERELYEDIIRRDRERNNGSLVGYRAAVVSNYICTPAGDRVVMSNGQVDRQKVSKLSALLQSRSNVALDRLFDACSRINGLTPEDAEAIRKKSLEGLQIQNEDAVTSESQ